jgi:uncharacterized membrane protein
MRDPAVSAALGTTLKGSPFLTYVNFVISWLTVIFIAIGVLTIFIRYRHTISFSDLRESQCSEFLSRKLDIEFFILILVCSLIIAISIALPFVFVGYSLGRAYFQMMVVLSPFFVIGGIIVARFLRAKWTYLMVLVVLIPFSMNSTGILPQLFAESSSPILNSAEKIDNFYYIYDCEAYSARWLEDHADMENTKVYSDFPGSWRLLSCGLVSQEFIDRDQLTDKDRELKDGFIYLRYDNVVKEILYSYSPITQQWGKHDITEFQNKFAKRRLIYSNGGSEVWR